MSIKAMTMSRFASTIGCVARILHNYNSVLNFCLFRLPCTSHVNVKTWKWLLLSWNMEQMSTKQIVLEMYVQYIKCVCMHDDAK